MSKCSSPERTSSKRAAGTVARLSLGYLDSDPDYLPLLSSICNCSLQLFFLPMLHAVTFPPNRWLSASVLVFTLV